MPTSKSTQTYGYLSIVPVEDDLVSGGYLLVDHFGRPTEFHFSIPFSPDVAQKILFGRTFEEFVYCEQVGRPLLEKSDLTPDLILVQQPQLLQLGEHHPVIYVENPNGQTDKSENSKPSNNTVQMGEQSFQLHANADRNELCLKLNEFPDFRYLHEPFERIHEAISQAQRAAA